MSDHIEQEGREAPAKAAATLGDILYANPSADPVPEGEWAGLVRQVAAGDLPSLHALYERASRPVFVLALRICGTRVEAEDVTLEVFLDVWRRAWSYDAAEGTVLSWIMNQARTRARDRARLASRAIGAEGESAEPLDRIVLPASVQARLARRMADHLHDEPAPPPAGDWLEPAWEVVAPGISCKLLATDAERERVSMLVRLDPGASYPPHIHAGLEELHLLEGELHIDERTLVPGDYNRAEAASGDKHVWSETGCACVLSTNTSDRLL